MDIEIVKYGPDWEQAHIEFATKYFNGRRKRIHPTYLYWKFRGKQKEKLDSFLLAVENKKVVGQLGLLPCMVNINDTHFQAQWACDLMVHSNYRGKGIAGLLYEKAVNQKITLGSDPSPKASVSMLRFGFKNIEGPIKTFLPIKLKAITDKKVKTLSRFFGRFDNPLVRSNANNGNWLLLHEIGISDINFQEIFKFRDQSCVSVVHDENFYKWRLKAFKDYQLDGKFFYQSGNFFVTVRISGSILFVNDLFTINEQTFKKVLDGIIGFAKLNGISEIKLMENQNNRIGILKRKGFLSYSRRTNIIYYSRDNNFNTLIKDCKQFYYNSLDSDENI